MARARASAWQEAEEIARIADDLLVPAEVIGRFGRLKRRVLGIPAEYTRSSTLG